MLKGTSKAVEHENTREMKHRGMTEKQAVMASLKRSKKANDAEAKQMSSPSSRDQYSYNSRMELDHDMLEKLGLTQLPKVGDKVKLHAKAHVTSVSEHAHERDGKRRSVSLQMTHLGIK